MNSTLVQSVYQAYRAGRTRPKDTSVESSLQEFLAAVRQRVVPRLSSRELGFTSRCKRYCNLAREAAGRHDISKACESIGAAQACVQSEGLGPEAQLLCRAEITPAEAYLDLCCGDLEEARRRFLQAMEIDQELELHYGHRLLHGHRIHLQINMAAVEGSGLHTRDAMTRALHIFLYLSGKSANMPSPGAWGPGYIDLISAGMRQFFALQLTYEMAGLLAELQAPAVREHLAILLENPDFDATIDFWNPTIRGWIELKALSTGNVPAYLERAIPFLAKGPDISLAIWQAAALDAAFACRVLSPTLATDFQREAAEGITKLSYAPQQLRRVAWQARRHFEGAEICREDELTTLQGRLSSPA